MKKNLFLLVIILLLVTSTNIKAVPTFTPIIDGVKDAGWGDTGDTNSTGLYKQPNVDACDRLYLSNDASNLYIGFELKGDPWDDGLSCHNQFAIDINFTSAGNGTDPWVSTTTVSWTNLPDFWITSWLNLGIDPDAFGGVTLYKWTGSWTSMGTPIHAESVANNWAEISIPFTNLGVTFGDVINILHYWRPAENKPGATDSDPYDAAAVSDWGDANANFGTNIFFSYTIQVVDILPPDPPSNFSATPLSASTIELSWNASLSNDTAGYWIYRGTNSGVYIVSNFVAGRNVTTYTDKWLDPSTTYYYNIKSIDDNNNLSDYSGETNATTLAPDSTIPDAPTNLFSVPMSGTSLKLTWNTAASNDVVGYWVYWGETPSNYSSSNLVDGRFNTNFVITNLKNYTTYYLAVKSIDSSYNISPFSSEETNRTQKIAIDGNGSDWLGDNTGLGVGEYRVSSNEFILNDMSLLDAATGNQWDINTISTNNLYASRTNFDIDEVRITGYFSDDGDYSNDFLYIYIKFADIKPGQTWAPFIQLQLDTDNDPATGRDTPSEWYDRDKNGDEAKSYLIGWEYLICANDGPDILGTTNKIVKIDTDYVTITGIADSYVISDTNNIIEFAIPFSAIGNFDPVNVSSNMRLALLVSPEELKDVREINDTSDVMDVAGPGTNVSNTDDLDDSGVMYIHGRYTYVLTFDHQGQVIFATNLPDFVSQKPPLPPVLLSPTNGTVFYYNNVPLKWSFVDPEVGDYQTKAVIQLSLNNNFSTIYASYTNESSSTNYIAYPDYGNTYYWRVKTWDSGNMESGWSATNYFIIVPLKRDVLDDTATDWLGVPSANEYDAVVSSGEWIWTDKIGDTADFVEEDPSNYDLTEFRVTADKWRIYFLVKFYNLPCDFPEHIRIAVVTNSAYPTNGQEWFGGGANVKVSTNALWNSEIFVNQTSTGIYDSNWNLKSGVMGKANCVENISEFCGNITNMAIKLPATIRVSFLNGRNITGSMDPPLDCISPIGYKNDVEADGRLNFWFDIDLDLDGNVVSNSPPDQVSQLTNLSSPTDNTPTLQWNTSPGDPDAGDFITMYQIQVDDNSNFSSPIFETSTFSPTITNITVKSPLPSSGTYYWRVAARDNHGTLSKWVVSQFDIILYEPITGLTNVDVTTNSVSLKWNSLASNTNRFAYYVIYYSTNENNVFSDQTWTTNDDPSLTFVTANSTTITNLVKNRIYFFNILWYSTNGIRSGYNPHLRISTDFTPPEPVTNLGILAVNDTSIELRWSANTNKDFDYYVIYYNTNSPATNGKQWLPVNDANLDFSGTTNTTITGLLPGTKYYFNIAVYDTSGNRSAISNIWEISTNTSNSLPPDTPANFRIIAYDENSVTLKWDTISQAPDFDSYVIYYDTTSPVTKEKALIWDKNKSENLGDINTSSTKIIGLVDGKRYYFAIAARDIAGNTSDLSPEVSVTLPSYKGAPVVYPNPALDCEVYFVKIDKGSIVKVYNINRVLVWTSPVVGDSRRVVWDTCKDSVPSGVYLAVVTKDGEKKVLKIVIIK